MYKKIKSKLPAPAPRPLIGAGGIRRITPIAIPLNPRHLIGGSKGIRRLDFV
jgi:hypothetical protein